MICMYSYTVGSTHNDCFAYPKCHAYLHIGCSGWVYTSVVTAAKMQFLHDIYCKMTCSVGG